MSTRTATVLPPGRPAPNRSNEGLPPRRTRLLQAVGEVALLAALFQLYRWARLLTAEDVGVAFDNAAGVLHLQQWLRMPSELTLQQWTLHSDSLVQAANSYYAVVHFPLTAGFLVWAFLYRPRDYGWIRTSVVGLTAAGLVVHLVMPLAPPRMMPGFVDTGELFGQSVYAGSLGEAANQIAAMPSLHVGWAVLVAVGVLATTRTRWRWLAVVHPVVTVAVVVVTGNHYWLDALVATVLLGLALLLLAPGRLRRLPWLALDRTTPAASATTTREVLR